MHILSEDKQYYLSAALLLVMFVDNVVVPWIIKIMIFDWLPYFSDIIIAYNNHIRNSNKEQYQLKTILLSFASLFQFHFSASHSGICTCLAMRYKLSIFLR